MTFLGDFTIKLRFFCFSFVWSVKNSPIFRAFFDIFFKKKLLTLDGKINFFYVLLEIHKKDRGTGL